MAETHPQWNIPVGTKGIALSDLHLGMGNTYGERNLRKVENYLLFNKTGLVVLNGDIIETKELTGGREKMLGEIRKHVRRVEKFIENAKAANPDCRVVFVYGNHDNARELREMLDELQTKYPDNFHTEGSFWRYKDTLFLHGDQPLNVAGDFPLLGKYFTGQLDRYVDPHTGRLERPLEHDKDATGLKSTDEVGKNGWRSIDDEDGWQRLRRDMVVPIKAAIGGRLDKTLLTPILWPLDRVMGILKRTIELYDKEHADAPEQQLLAGPNPIKRVIMGHVHCPRNEPYTDPESKLEMIVTGASTGQYPKEWPLDTIKGLQTGTRTSINQRSAANYVFDIGEHGFSNFEIMNAAKVTGPESFTDRVSERTGAIRR